MIILGIETSCDETALALLETRQINDNDKFLPECRVLASLVHSQAELHSAYGGVFPTLAKREHGKNLVPLLHKLLIEAALPERDVDNTSAASLSHLEKILEEFREEIAPQNPELFESFAHAEFLKEPAPTIDAIAVTEGPGLEPALWTGINLSRMLGAVWSMPIIPVDHMEGHILGSLLTADAANGAWHKLADVQLPAIALLISGGHTELVRIDRLGSYEVLGQTRDDAVGEAFDKTARLLGLPYPGGPHISELARHAAEEKLASPVKLPRPMIASGDLDFSFAGLKTAVLYAVRDASKDAAGKLSEAWKKGIAREFEQAVSDVLDAKLRKAIEQIGAKSIIIGGGVSANALLRERFTTTAKEFGLPLFLPSRHVSGDNALMIALAGAIGKDSGRLNKKKGAQAALRAQGTKKLGDKNQ